MKITNVGSKIVSIGASAVLPGATAEIPDSYASNPIIKLLAERGRLTVVAAKKAAGTKKPPA